MTTLTKNPEVAEEIHLQSAPVHFKSILVATDFSPDSLKALQVAAAAARRFAAQVHIVHVASPVVYAADLSLTPITMERAVENARLSMKDWSEHPLLSGLKHSDTVLEGSLVDELREYVDTRRIDLVVVGTAGRTGVQKVFLGSEAESIVRHLSCPVMIVGPNVGRIPTQYQGIVFATSLHPTSLRAAQYAVALAELLDARLTMLHVEASGDKESFDEQARKDIYQRLRNLLPLDSECWFRPKVRFEVGDPAAQILASAAQDDADLIVMSSHDDSVLADHAPWSVLANVVRDAKCPVLAVRAHFA